jgi:hypothetical protein
MSKTDTPRLLRSPPSQEGNSFSYYSVQGVLGYSTVEREASSSLFKSIEEAGCVKMRIPGSVVGLKNLASSGKIHL